MSLYNFKIEKSDGQQINLENYRGKVLLIVNTASRCGFTGQYAGLTELYEKYKGMGLEILAFPCNQFGGQEPGSDKEIESFCSLNFNVSFPLFKKIDVNGKNTNPLFKFLKKEAPGFLGTRRIKWNFTKFLVDREGKVIKRFAPTTKPERIRERIESLLN